VLTRLSWLIPFALLPLYLLPLGLRPLWIPDEARYAEISREMISSGDWITPHFLNLRYFEKPVMGYWANNLGQLIFGESNFAIRSLSALSAIGAALLIFWLTRRVLQCQRSALFAATIYLSFFIVYMIGSFAVLDSLLAFWITAAFCAYYWAYLAENRRQRLRRHLLFGLLCGAAFLTKGFVALALLIVAIVPFMLIKRRWRELVGYGVLAVIAAASVAAPWAISIHLQEPDFWNYFFWEEHIRRFSGKDAQHGAPFWFYIPWLALGAMPWALALIPSVKSKVWQQDGSFYLYLLLWFAAPLLLLSIASGKLPTYILPIFAPLAIFFGSGLKRYLDAEADKALKWLGWSNLAFTGLAVVGLLLMVTGLIGKAPVYALDEAYKPILALAVLGSWAALAWWLLKKPRASMAQVAAMPMAFMLLTPFVVPQSIIDSKAPEVFLQNIAADIDAQTTVITNNVGLAAAIAWQLKKPDLLLWGGKGEVAYGLDYADAQDRYIRPEAIGQAITEHQKQGDVALLLRRKNRPEQGEFPPPDLQRDQGRFHLYLYRKTP
tara:strand:- start:176 stop:1825 length:1650 start_codon:yes stop_codon:yes gene_type:complete